MQDNKIIKSKKDRDFTTIWNVVLKNKKLSLAAKGLYCYLEHLPLDWVFYKKEIMSNSSNARSSFDTAWDELEKAGYIVGADIIRSKGQFGGREFVFYALTDEDEKVRNLSNLPMHDLNTPMHDSYTGTDARNVQLLNTNNTTNTKVQKIAAHAASLEDRKKAFYQSLVPYTFEFTKKTVREFYEWWTECNEGGKKMKFEAQKFFEIKKRLATWKKREIEGKFKKPEETEEEYKPKINYNPQEIDNIGTSAPGSLH